LVELGPVQLKKLAEAVAKRELTLNLRGLVNDLAKTIQFPSPHRLEVAFTAVLMPLGELCTGFLVRLGGVIELLSKRIEEQNPDWLEERREGWVAAAPALSPLIGPDCYFGLLQKAFRLAGTQSAAATDIKILTELRPVYDDEVTTTKAMLLT